MDEGEARRIAETAFLHASHTRRDPDAIPTMHPMVRLQMNAAIDAYLAELRRSFAVVPREPTEEMLEAAVTALSVGTSETEYDTPRTVYAAMIQAAEANVSKG